MDLITLGIIVLFIDLDEPIDVIGSKELVLCSVRTNGIVSR